MNYESHVIVGVGSLSAFLLIADVVGLAAIPSPAPLAASLGMAAVGAIAPDIDHPRSMISASLPTFLLKMGSRLLFFISIPALITVASSRRYDIMNPETLFKQDIFRLLVVVILGASGLLALSRIVHVFFKHRGPIHSPTFYVGVSVVTPLLIALVIPGWWWMGLIFGWGWFSHLVADSLTPSGIPIFWPLTNKKYNILPDILLPPARFLLIALSIFSMILLIARMLKFF